MIYAKVLADSKHWQTGTRLTTFEISIHRYVLAEANTHKMLSKNSASSRAVPIKANIEHILSDTAYPIHWGKNQAGMVADEELSPEQIEKAKEIWTKARDSAIQYALELSELGVHKQLANRLIENFSYQKIVISGTEWDNFFWLRNHGDAQPEISAPAKAMLDAYNASTPMILSRGGWHTPYVDRIIDESGFLHYYSDGVELDVSDAIKVSASCCAQSSYRKNDSTLEKANIVFDRLNLSNDSPDVRKHSSPVEHIGTPIDYEDDTIETIGITHQDIDGHLWSANFKDYVQYRHLIPNESCKNHPEIIKK